MSFVGPGSVRDFFFFFNSEVLLLLLFLTVKFGLMSEQVIDVFSLF